MGSPAEHAATVREALTSMGMSHAQRDALAALNALEAQAETLRNEINRLDTMATELSTLLRAAEAERDRLRKMLDAERKVAKAFRAERDEERARVEELEAALREIRDLFAAVGGVEGQMRKLARAALDKDTA